MKKYNPPECILWEKRQLDSIEAKMSGFFSDIIGTENNPESFSNSITINLPGEDEYWLKCTISGAAFISFTSTANCEIIIKLGNTELRTLSGRKSEVVLFDKNEVNNGYNVFKIKIKSSLSTTITLFAKQNKDEQIHTSTENVLQWKPVTNSVKPYLIDSYNWIYYARGTALYVLYNIVENNEYFEKLENTAFVMELAYAALSGVGAFKTLATQVTEVIAKRSVGVACSIFSVFEVSEILSIRNEITSVIKTVGNYDQSTGKYPANKGIFVDLHFIRLEHAEQVYVVDEWEDETAYGALGMKGEFYES